MVRGGVCSGAVVCVRVCGGMWWCVQWCHGSVRVCDGMWVMCECVGLCVAV